MIAPPPAVGIVTLDRAIVEGIAVIRKTELLTKKEFD
jgi:hypothetical protein